MNLNPDACYAAMQTHDARFDGRFFVGVSSTRVYCRPVCRVKMPMQKNCTFYPSAAAAENHGFRPCLRCRPEQAPGHAPVDASSRLAYSAAALIQEGELEECSLEVLADRLGVTSRHIRRVFATEFGVSPVEYAQTHRLLTARRLLRDTPLGVTEVALASGFGSVRRFNALFAERYRTQPGQIRQARATPKDALEFELGFRPPYAWDEMLRFLHDRTLEGIEEVTDCYRRTVALRRAGELHTGWVEVRMGKQALKVRVSPSLSAVLPRVLQRVRRLFDLDARPLEIQEHLGDLVQVPGLRVAGAFDGFEMAVRAVLGQRISVQAARKLASKLAHKPIVTPFPALVRLFPEPQELAPTGVTRLQTEALQGLAEACASGHLHLSPAANAEAEMAKLRQLRGFGEWTVQVIAMRALAWPDAFPGGDLGLRKAFPGLTDQQIEERARAWSPWRAYATLHLWRSL